MRGRKKNYKNHFFFICSEMCNAAMGGKKSNDKKK